MEINVLNLGCAYKSVEAQKKAIREMRTVQESVIKEITDNTIMCFRHEAANRMLDIMVKVSEGYLLSAQDFVSDDGYLESYSIGFLKDLQSDIYFLSEITKSIIGIEQAQSRIEDLNKRDELADHNILI